MCGQIMILGAVYGSEDEADAAAMQRCSCAGAKERTRRSLQIEEALQLVEVLFGEEAEQYGFQHEAQPEAVAAIKSMVEAVGSSAVNKVTISAGGYSAKIGWTSKGKLSVERTESVGVQMDA